jgi:glutathione S-transferase
MGTYRFLGIPTIIDHDNDDFALWESNSIINYLIERYDTENKLQFPRGTKEYFLVDQWMTFQVSGQVMKSTVCHLLS